MNGEEVKRSVLGIEIPRDELAFRIAQRCLGMNAPAGTNASDALDNMNMTRGASGDGMGEGFRRAADSAVLFFQECISTARRPT